MTFRDLFVPARRVPGRCARWPGVHLLLLAVLFGALFTPAQAQTLRVGTVAWIAFSPLHVAAAKGFWQARGLNVELTTFGSNQALNSALEQQDIDIALDMIGTWAGMHARGLPIVILGETDWSHGGDKIIARNTIDTTQLKGQTIGLYLLQPSVSFFLHKYLHTQQLQLSDVKLLELDPQTLADRFIAGQLPLIVNYDPDALRAQREGGGKVVATSATWPGIIPEGFAAHKSLLHTLPPARLQAFFQGWIEAVSWSKTRRNWPEYRTLLNRKTFGTEIAETDLKIMLDGVQVHDIAQQLARNKPGGGLDQYLQDLSGFLRANGAAKPDWQVQDAVATAALLKALKEAPTALSKLCMEAAFSPPGCRRK